MLCLYFGDTNVCLWDFPRDLCTMKFQQVRNCFSDYSIINFCYFICVSSGWHQLYVCGGYITEGSWKQIGISVGDLGTKCLEDEVVLLSACLSLVSMHATQALALRAMRALHKRKPQATQALDWLLWLTIPIGWRLHSLREKSYAMFFACVIFSRFLRTFYFACVFFLTQDLACVACVWMETGLYCKHLLLTYTPLRL